MFDRFTPEARKVMGFARQEAEQNNFIATRHFLTALSMVDSSASDAFRVFKLSTEDLRQESSKHDTRKLKQLSLGGIPFTQNAKKALEAAVEVAKIKGAKDITPFHLLLGVCACDGSTAQKVLRGLLTEEDINDALAAQIFSSKPKCEGCEEPATHADDYGIDLCEGCYEISEVPEPYQSPFTGEWV